MDWEYLKRLCDSVCFTNGLSEIGISKKEFVTKLEYLKCELQISNPIESQLYTFPSLARNSDTRLKRDREADDANHLRENIAKTCLVVKSFQELKTDNIRGHEKFFSQYPNPKNKGMLHQLYATIYLKKFIGISEIERGNKKGTNDNIDIVAKSDRLECLFHVITIDQMKKNMDQFLISSQVSILTYQNPLFTAENEKICPLGEEGTVPSYDSKVTLKSIHLIIRESTREITHKKVNKSLKWENPINETAQIIFDFLHEQKELPRDFFIRLIFNSDKSANNYEYKQYFKYMEKKWDPIAKQYIFVQTGKSKGIDHFYFLDKEFEKRSKKIRDKCSNHILMAFVPSLSNLPDKKIANCLKMYPAIKAILFFTVNFLPNNKGAVFTRSKIYSNNIEMEKLNNLIEQDYKLHLGYTS